MNYFGIRLKSLRLQDSLTQTELGRQLGIAKSTISLYENGKREPDFETVEKFADFFNVSMSTFFPSEDEHPATVTGSGMSTDYYDLTAENRALVDDLIAKLLKSQSAD